MKPAVQAFLTFASNTSLPNRDKAALLVFSRMLAFQLTIPSSPVPSANAYYADTHTSAVNELISDLNESVVIDVVYLRDLVRKVWLARYELVYCPLSANAQLLVNAILVGDNLAFSGELCDVATELSKDNLLGRITSLCIAADATRTVPNVVEQSV